MSKEIDHIKLEAPIEKAMDAMEPSTDITDEQLQEMLLDKESRQAVQDILDTQFFSACRKKRHATECRSRTCPLQKKTSKTKDTYFLENKYQYCCFHCPLHRDLSLHQSSAGDSKHGARYRIHCRQLTPTSDFR